MRQRLRSSLTYANVMVTILAFVVLGGGTAVALNGSNTVQSDDLGPGAQVKGADVADNAVNGADVANNSLDGADVNESSLAKVPNADKLDGINSSGLIRGQGRILTIDTVAFANNHATLLDLPGFVRVDGHCQGTGSPGTTQVGAYGQPVGIVSQPGAFFLLKANHSASGADWAMSPTGDSLTLSFEASDGKVATAFIFSHAFHSNLLQVDLCSYQGQVIVKGG